MKHFIAIILLISSFLNYAQTSSDEYGVGSWQVHLPYKTAQELAITPSRIYCNSGTGLFYYNKSDNSLNKFSKIDGLSDSEIGTIAYSSNQNALVIGYTNGNVDILKDNTIFNVFGIKDSENISGSKKINHIKMYDEFAYLSCDFGLVKLDLDKIEIKDSYLNSGPMGSSPSIFQADIVPSKDSIFLATEEGVFAASLLPQYNLSDFNSWKHYSSVEGIDNTNIKYIAALNDTVYAFSETEGLYFKKGLIWNKVVYSFDDLTKATNLNSSNGELFLSFDDGLGSYRILSSTDIDLFTKSPAQPNYYEYDNNTLWAADELAGLVKMKNDDIDFNVSPNGPDHKEIFRFYSRNNEVIGLSGAYQGSFVGPRNLFKGVYVYQDFSWINNAIGGYSDVIDMEYVNGTYYIASFNDGLLVWDGQNVTNVYDQNSFTIENGDTVWCPLIAYNGGDKVRVTDVVKDKSGNLWVCNHIAKSDKSTPIHRLSPSGQWTSYTLNNVNATAPVRMVIDDFGTKWITIKGNEGRKGGFAFNDEFGFQKYFSESSVGLPDTEVTVMRVNKENNVWIGTAKGVALAKDVGNAFLNGYRVDIPISGSRPLLEEEFINDIAVDGGNRAWIATNNGVFLVSPEGDEILLNLTEENSFLNSNNVTAVGINEVSGEVLFGTEKGIISYWGNATEPEEGHESVKVFPNPVRPEFDGQLGVTGLPANATVKFTDVSGNLVYETDAAGGMAVWDMRDVNGQEVASGVYLIFSSSLDGEDAFAGKVVVVR